MQTDKKKRVIYNDTNTIKTLVKDKVSKITKYTSMLIPNSESY